MRFISLFLASITVTATFATLAIAQAPVNKVIPNRYIIGYRSGQVPAALHTAPGVNVITLHSRLGIAVIRTSAATRESLVADPAVEFIVQDRLVSAHSVTVRPAASARPAVSSAPAPDALYNSPRGWAVRQVGGSLGTAAHPGAWTYTKGSGVRIAILDSGVDRTHPDIAPNLQLNLSEVDQSAATGLPSPCDDGTPQDQQGHGTWTASLAAGALGEGTGDIAGVAPEATILNIKVLERMPSDTRTSADPSGCSAGQAAGLLSWVLKGIDDAVANRADIISLSLGTLVDVSTGDGAGLKTLFDHATHAAAQSGIILIAAAGNEGLSLARAQFIELPAQSRDVLALIASTNPDCVENTATTATCTPGPVTMPYYSNFGAPLNALAAPGGSYPAALQADASSASGWITGACSQGIPSTLSGALSDAAHSFGCFGLGHAAYVDAMGTSASAPLAAGAAALIRAANPTWSAAAVVAELRRTATPAAGLPVPMLDATAAVLAARIHTNHILAPTITN